MKPLPHPPYSWRDDSKVPAFDDDRVLVVMDDGCALCSFGARRIAAADRHDRVRIAPASSPLGQALLEHFGYQPNDPESWLTLSEGQGRGSLDGVIATYVPLSWIYRPLVVLRILPTGLQDWIYARIARNRIAVFGRADMCAIPDPELQSRLVR